MEVKSAVKVYTGAIKKLFKPDDTIPYEFAVKEKHKEIDSAALYYNFIQMSLFRF